MDEKITYEEFRALRKTDPVAGMRAQREGRVTGMPPELKRRLASAQVAAQNGSPLDRLERFVRDGAAIAEQRKQDEQTREA